MILRPGHKPKQMTLWFHPMFEFPGKGDILQIPDSNGDYTSYLVMSTSRQKREVVLKRIDQAE